MNFRRVFFCLLFLNFFAISPLTSAADSKSLTELYIDGLHSAGKERVIVSFKDDAAVDVSLVNKYSGKLIRAFTTIKSLVCEIPKKNIEALRSEKTVKNVSFDVILRTQLDVEKRDRKEKVNGRLYPLYSGPVTVRWNNLEAGMNSKAAWDRYGLDGAGVKIAFLDTGIGYLMPNLGGGIGSGFKCLGGYDFVDNDNDPINPTVGESHGTMITSAAVGKGIEGGKVVGVAYNANYYALRVAQGSGSAAGLISDAMSAIEWASTEPHKADIISMSFGVYDEEHTGDPFWPFERQEFEAVCNNAYDAGVVLVAGSGNEGYDHSGYPAAFANVVSVGGYAEDQTLYNYLEHSSNGGVDIIAPGARVYSVHSDNSGWWGYGTSMATSHAAAFLALQLQYARLNNIQPNNGYLWELLKHSAKHLTGPPPPAEPCPYDPVYQGAGKIWAADTTPMPPDMGDGSIDCMTAHWPISYGFVYGNYAYITTEGYPAYYIGTNMYYTANLTNNTDIAGTCSDDIENLDVTTTQAYYGEHDEAVLPGDAVEEFTRLNFLSAGDAESLEDIYYIPLGTYPGLDRIVLDLEFELASDTNNRLIKVTYPYASIWCPPPAINEGFPVQ